MRAKLVVFPVKGRNWCFSRSIDNSPAESASPHTPSTLKELWKNISSDSRPINVNAELLVDFVSNKMNRAWIGLEKAPDGSFKNKIHRLGLTLLARVKPSEIFLKSISKEVTNVEVAYPPSLNARLVRRRLRHVAMRGTVIHKKFLYGSVSLLPLTSAFSVLPLPNVPFFWVLFRTYSHWRALKGSEKLLQLVSDCSQTRNSAAVNMIGSETKHGHSKHQIHTWVLQPSMELEELLHSGNEGDGLSKSAISDICKIFDLNMNDVLKYRSSL